jgi:hypothetical protein
MPIAARCIIYATFFVLYNRKRLYVACKMAAEYLEKRFQQDILKGKTCLKILLKTHVKSRWTVPLRNERILLCAHIYVQTYLDMCEYFK